jgi:hypothetical protein
MKVIDHGIHDSTVKGIDRNMALEISGCAQNINGLVQWQNDHRLPTYRIGIIHVYSIFSIYANLYQQAST